jgi:hypothetical protein
MNPDIVYVVAAMMRSGTSMMMHSLIAGGMRAAYEKKDLERLWVGDYHPNKNGFFELSRKDVESEDFPSQFHGYLIKVPIRKLGSLHPTRSMKIIYMYREFEKIEQSFDKLEEINNGFSRRKRPIVYWDKLPFTFANLINRTDIVSFDVVPYDGVVNNPLKWFTYLAKKGWPIDPEKCAEIPDSKLRHF